MAEKKITDLAQTTNVNDADVLAIVQGGITKRVTKQDLSSSLQGDPGPWTGRFESQLLHVQDQKSSGTEGGTFNSGSWKTRDLNTELTNDISGASLGSNQITLPAGTYYIEAVAPVNNVDDHIARLQNVTDGTTTIWSQSSNASGGGHSHLFGRFTIGASKTFELQHQCQTGQSTVGFGTAFGAHATVDHETYSDVRIWKVG
jgi:hypothetical protein